MNKGRQIQSAPSIGLSLIILLLCCGFPPSTSAVPQNNSPNAAQQHDWQTYTNVRFAYSVCYPADLLVPQGEAENSDGQKFLSRDGRAQMLVYGSNNALNQTVADAYSDELKSEAQDGLKTTYKLLKPGYFVISGAGGGKIVYEKTVLVGDVFKTVRLEYPEEMKSVFDPIASTVSGCFHTNLKSQT